MPQLARRSADRDRPPTYAGHASTTAVRSRTAARGRHAASVLTVACNRVARPNCDEASAPGQRALERADEFTHAAHERSEQAAAAADGRDGRNARRTLPLRASASTKRGNSDRIESVSMSPAWMPPSSGSAISRDASRAPKRRRKNEATDSSPASRRARHQRFERQPRARGGREQVVARQFPPRRRNAEHRRGRQRMEPAALEHERGARREWSSISRAVRPSASQSSSAAGFCASTESGPASMVKPSTCSVRIRPPDARRGFEELKGTRRAISSYAADSPVMPPPTTITMDLRSRVRGGTGP